MYTGKNERKLTKSNFPFIVPKDGFLKVVVYTCNDNDVVHIIFVDGHPAIHLETVRGNYNSRLLAVKKGQKITYKTTSESNLFTSNGFTIAGYSYTYGIYYSEL